MHFRDERTRRIEHAQAAHLRVVFDLSRHAMRAEDRDRARGDFGQMFDEARAFGAEAFDDVAVVHDFVSYVDGRSEFRQCVLDDVDRANHTGAKAARLRQYHAHGENLCWC